MKRYQTLTAVLGFALLTLSSLVFLGCEVGSSDSAVRNVSANYSGVYDAIGDDGVFVDPANSGNRVTSFLLRQSGDQLQAFDNNMLVFDGTVNDVVVNGGNSEAGFQLTGRTTAGAQVTISGTLTGVGTAGKMQGTWIEPDRYCLLLGDGVINAAPTNQPGTSFTFTWTSTPSGAGSVTPASGSSYSAGTVISVSATSSGTNVFTGWTGDLAGTLNPNSVTMSVNRSVTAHFNNQ